MLYFEFLWVSQPYGMLFEGYQLNVNQCFVCFIMFDLSFGHDLDPQSHVTTELIDPINRGKVTLETFPDV